jgi:uncharacterized protein YgbK (DUF1537 family)
MVVVSGSVNQITLDQLNYAKERVFSPIPLNTHQKLDKNYPVSSEGKSLFLISMSNIGKTAGLS